MYWSGAKCAGRHLVMGEAVTSSPVFYALAHDTQPAPPNTVALYEYVNDVNGEYAYSTDDALSLPGFDLTATPVGLVWRNPLSIRLPVGDYLAPFIADAGGDICTVESAPGSETASVTLDGTATSHTSGAISSYAWLWSGGSANGATPRVSLPVGLHVITLVATDNSGLTSEDTLVVEVTANPGLETDCYDGLDNDGDGVTDCEDQDCQSTVADTCNGIDDDCDGSIDEDFSGTPTTCGVGACFGNTGTLTCEGASGPQDSCDEYAGAAADDATCDNVDDDCDGIVDEDFISFLTTCGIGACAGNTGHVTCVVGVEVGSCNPLAGAATEDATCDGVDDDCDGIVDEDYLATGTTCGVGACAENTGSMSCSGGSEIDDCDPLAGAANNDASCDGVDSDCDGVVDEDCGAGSTVLWISFKSSTVVPGLGTVRDEDIVAFDDEAATWTWVFDGSDVGVGSLDIDGITELSDGSILMSFTATATVPGMGTVDDSDIVRFVPTSLGSTTAGTFQLYFDGSDVGLISNGEDVDGITLHPDGRLMVSTTGSFSGSGASGADEDLFLFSDTSLGSSTSGSFAQYFDGSDVGLSTSRREDVDAVALGDGGLLSLSTVGSFSVVGAAGADEDVVDMIPTQVGKNTSGTFGLRLDLSTLGISGSEDVGAMSWSSN